MPDITQNSRINVFINDTQAKKSIPEQEALVRKLRNEWRKAEEGSVAYFDKLEELNKANEKLKFHKDQVKNIATAWKNVTDTSERANTRVNDLTKTIDGNNSGWGDANRNLEEFNQRSPQAIKNIEQSNVAVKKGRTLWQEMMYQAKVFGGLALGYLGITTLFSKVGQGVQSFAKISDVMADVQRTTGMTATQVERLKEDLATGIDSRTTTVELLELAKAGGKLGIAQKDINGFVRAADKINIALGEDLGKDAITSIGKIVNIFHLKDEFGLEQAMLKVGSAINSAGQASEAQEGYIVDFLNRMGGVAPLMKMTATEIIGLGATLDSLGQTSEVSSTSLSKLFINMAEDSETYARFAGMNTQEFVKLLNEDAVEAFIRVLEGSQKTSGGITALTATLGDLGIEGGRATGVFGTLANNTDKLRAQIDIANNSFREGTSITQEYTTKNETFGAALDKLMKRINGYVVNSSLTKWLTDLISKMGDTSSEVEKMSSAYENQKLATSNLEKSVTPLIDRYNTLRRQASLNSDEQTELEGLIKKIAEILPTAVTEWDKYGNAIDVSSDKVREAIKQNKELTQAMGENEISALRNELKNLNKDAARIQKEMNAGGYQKTTYGRQGSYSEFIPYDLNAKKNELIRTNKQIYDDLKRLSEEFQLILTQDELNFINRFENQFATVSETVKKTEAELEAEAAAAAAAEELRKEREAEEKKRQEKYKSDAEALKKFIQDKDHELLVSKMSANEAELAEINFRYQQEIEMAKGHAAELKKIEELRDKEIADAIARQKTAFLNLRADVQEEIFVALADEYTLSMKKIDDFYEQLILKAEEYKLDTTELFKSWTEASNKFNQETYAAFGQGLAMGLQKAFATTTEESKKTTESSDKLQDSLEGTALAWVNMGLAAVESADDEHSAMEVLFNSIRTHIKALMAEAIAKAIVGAIGAGPAGLLLAGVAGVAAGALFDKLIPEFAGGGFGPDHAQIYMAHEKGREWIAPHHQLQNPETRPYIDALEEHRTSGRFPEWFSSMGYVPNYKAMTVGMNNAFARNGGFGSSTITTNNNHYGGTTDTGRIEHLLEVLIDTTEKNKDILFPDKSITGFNRRDNVIDRKLGKIY